MMKKNTYLAKLNGKRKKQTKKERGAQNTDASQVPHPLFWMLEVVCGGLIVVVSCSIHTKRSYTVASRNLLNSFKV